MDTVAVVNAVIVAFVLGTLVSLPIVAMLSATGSQSKRKNCTLVDEMRMRIRNLAKGEAVSISLTVSVDEDDDDDNGGDEVTLPDFFESIGRG